MHRERTGRIPPRLRRIWRSCGAACEIISSIAGDAEAFYLSFSCEGTSPYQLVNVQECSSYTHLSLDLHGRIHGQHSPRLHLNHKIHKKNELSHAIEQKPYNYLGMIETRTHLDLRLWLQRHREQRIAIPVVDLVLATLKYTRCLHVVSIPVSEWRLREGRSLVMLRSGHAGLHIGNWMTGIE